MKIDQVNIQKAAQTALVQEAQSAHFYTPQGAARYSDKVKTGPNKGKECAVNLRHARKENLYPSITHIHKCLSERALTFYRESHLLAAARKLEPHENETEVDYYHRVNIESRKDSLEAAQGGTNVHKSLESILKNGEWDKNDPRLVSAAEWIKRNIYKTVWIEKTLVNHSLMLAGRCDAFVHFKTSSVFFKELGRRPVILDFKTRRFKTDKEGEWIGAEYKKDVGQVAFYASCLNGWWKGSSEPTLWRGTGLRDHQPPRTANLLINTTPEAPEDLRPQLNVYSPEKQLKALVAVAHLSAIWRHQNNYEPQNIKIPEDEMQRMEPVRERMWG